jgi:hypothetical protein
MAAKIEIKRQYEDREFTVSINAYKFDHELSRMNTLMMLGHGGLNVWLNVNTTHLRDIARLLASTADEIDAADATPQQEAA